MGAKQYGKEWLGILQNREETSATDPRNPECLLKMGTPHSLSIVLQLIKPVPTAVLLGAAHQEYKGKALPACEEFKVKHLEESC